MRRIKLIFFVLLLFATAIWLAVFSFDKQLHLISCDVGQGDAMLAVFGKIQILVDGGPNNKVIDCISRHVPFWDREIEVVVLTHPEIDHFGGLVEVLKRYKVDYLLANPIDSSDQAYQVLTNEVGGREVTVINPTTGLKIGNSLIYLDVLFPSKTFLDKNLETSDDQNPLKMFETKINKNSFSIVTLLHFGNFSALLPGDIDQKGEEEILKTFRNLNTDYLKVPHHGSKNGLTEEFLEKVLPAVAVISVGAKNSYGHPHQEILDLLKKYDVEVFRTDKSGDVELTTDGESWRIK